MHEEQDENAELTEEQRERMRMDYGEQGENGYDFSLFRENLRRTPTERIERLQRAISLYQEVKRAGRNYRLSRRNPSPR